MNLDETPDLVIEQRLLQVLGLIQEEMNADLERELPELTTDTAFEQLGAIESWASVISSAIARVDASTSPWRRKVAGWAKEVSEKIRWIAALLLAPLSAVASVLGASSWSIGLNFPWGVSVALTWP